MPQVLKKRTSYFFNFIGMFIISLCFMEQSFALALNNIGPKRKLFAPQQIIVEGIKKVEKEAILQKITIKKGKRFDNVTLKRDIEKIYSMKFFDYVEAYQEKRKGKNVLIFRVKEKPIVNRIVLEGNDELDDDELKEQVKTKEYSILDINTIKNDVKALEKFYEEKGFFLASVNFNIKKIDDENIELIFKINELEKVKVKKITFLGNRAFEDNQLKAIMETREEALFSWMTGSGSFKEFNFQTDIERVKYFYKSKGHLQVFVGNPEITVSEDKKWIFITISVNEGPKFTINDIVFDGEVLFPEEDLLEKIALKTKDEYSEDKLRKDIQLLTELYQDQGYAFANVLRTLHIVPGENKVDIQFSFEKGKIAKFGKITVKGNSKTRDKVIRRELKIREGMKFSGTSLRESRENVNRLGFFEPNSVVFKTVSPPGQDDVLDVDITIKERNTGQITLGAGYSTATKGFIQGSIRQNNFRGLGQILSFSLNIADQQQEYNLGFTEPYWNDSLWTAGGDIFSTKNTQSISFDVDRKGFNARLGYPIIEYGRLFVTYKFEDTELTEINDPLIDANLENGVASSVDTTFVYDKRNNQFEPTKGYYHSLSVEYTGLGGDKKWLESVYDGRYYKNIYGELVLRSRLRFRNMTQIGDRQVPRTEKYFLGGAKNLRGYDFEAIGPRSTIPFDTNGDGTIAPGEVRSFNQRGLFSFLSTLEFEHPLVKEAGLKWVIFADAGNVWRRYLGENDDYSLKLDYGFGFRWFSPIGVLRFELGYPLNKSDTDRSSQFHFDIGQLF